MIKAVSNFKQSDSNISLNYNLSDASNLNDNKFIKPNQPSQVSFTSLNYSKTGKNLFRETISHLSGKLRRFAEEAAESARGLFRKLKGKEKLSYSERPITCNISTNEKVEAEAKRIAQENALAASKRRISIDQIEASGNPFSAGDVDKHGNVTSSGQHKIDNPTRAHRKYHDDSNNDPSFRGQESVDDLTANDGINDLDNVDLGNAGELDRIDNTESLSVGNLEKMGNGDLDSEKLASDLDLGEHDLDLDHHDLGVGVDDPKLEHDLGGHELEPDPDLVDVPDPDIDPSDLV